MRWIGRACSELPRLAIERTRGSPAIDASHASLRVTEYGKYFASRIATTPGGVTSVKRCCVLVTSTGTALSGTRA
jgi:hypothetical protein